ncbi:MAG: VWA domain-containing protein [Myxococcaceae bacterium]|nr:VWA domain-containing protein [Myxococcaceae bacterium]
MDAGAREHPASSTLRRTARTSPFPGPLAQLRRRIDALREGTVAFVRMWDRLVPPVLTPRALGELPELTALTRELDRLCVHTLGDVRLLRTLQLRRGRGAKLADGLETRARVAMGELARAVRVAERAQLAGRPLAGAASALENHHARLVRVARVADVFREPVAPGEADDGPFTLLPPVESHASRPPSAARIAVVEYLEARARAEVWDIAQKRRDLDVAHELLLRLSTSLERERVRDLRHEVAQARARAREMPVTHSPEEVLRQMRGRSSKEPDAAYRSLHGLYTRALESGDAALARTAWAAIFAFLPDMATLDATPEGRDGALADLAFQLTPEQAELFEMAAGCARFVDVEDALAETVVEVRAPQPPRATPRRVPYPTQHLELGHTGSPHDAHAFVLSDPRRLLHDLASHRQLVRTYLEEEPAPAPRPVRRSSVRVYVCDASGSMSGQRARFRDALLLAELQNLRARARRTRVVEPLYVTFFSDRPSEIVRVDSPDEAARQMERIFRTSPAHGQTDITLALLTAFESIRAARGQEPSLASATVVLVTDGEDRVDLSRIREAREPVAGVSIALSFLSLGEENLDLKALVMEQRSLGERAFYQHLSDDDLQWARTAFSTPWRTLLPPSLPVRDVDLDALLPHLDALEALAAGAPVRPVRPPEGAFEALFPAREALIGLPARPVAPEVQERVADVLEAVVETAAIVPAEERAEETVALLEHLRGVYGVTVPDYLAVLAAGGPRVETALARVRLLCRPLG